MTEEELKENIKRNLYQAKDGKTQRDFFDDLVELFKLDPTDPIVIRMYSMAWSNGHSCGYTEVFYHFQDLVEVFKG